MDLFMPKAEGGERPAVFATGLLDACQAEVALRNHIGFHHLGSLDQLQAIREVLPGLLQLFKMGQDEREIIL